MSDWLSLSASIALALILAALAGTVHVFSPVAKEVLSTSVGKIHTLDGLRGVVALMVVLSHCILAFQKVECGCEIVSSSNFQNQMGSAAVSIFFMISAYLFCGALIRNNGRLDVVRFVEGRFVRIIPPYTLMVVIVTWIAFYEQGFNLVVPFSSIVKSWVRIYLFDFLYFTPLNHIVIKELIAQTWTLKYEWLLYAIIPFLAISMRLTRAIWPLFFGLIACMFYFPIFGLFVAGAAASILVKINGPRARMMWQILGAAGLMIDVFAYHDSRGWQQAVLLTPFFVAVLQGHRWYALFGSRSLRFLGDISFSLYLLHNFVLWAAGKVLSDNGGYESLGFASLTAVYCAVGIVSILVALGSFLLVEKPTMGWRPISSWLAERKKRRIDLLLSDPKGA